MSGFSLRPATADDVAVLTEIVNDAYSHYIPRIGRPPMPMQDDYAEVVRDYDVTIAEVDGAPVGLLALGRDGDYGFHVANLAVRPAAQGMGIGRALLELAEARATEAGADSILLWTHELMTENRALYRYFGYVEEPPAPTPEDPRVFLRKALTARKEGTA